MHLFHRLSLRLPLLLAIGATLGALVLLWSVRDAPWQPIPEVSVDALSAFFLFAMFGGVALLVAVQPRGAELPSWRTGALLTALIAGYVTTLTPAIVGAYALVALLTLPQHGRDAPRTPITYFDPPDPRRTRRSRRWRSGAH